MKRFSFLLIILFAISNLPAQILEPVSWEFSSEYLGEDEFNIIHTATIDAGWHLYSQDIGDGGPVPTSFIFEENKRAEYVGKVIEKGDKIDKFDKFFDMQVAWYENKVQFIQKVKLNKPRTTIKGELEFMVCDDEQCLPPFTSDLTNYWNCYSCYRRSFIWKYCGHRICWFYGYSRSSQLEI